MHSEENISIKGAAKSRPCLNCDATLLADATHCHQCGQAIKEAKMTVRSLLSVFFANLFNLDSKIWKTLRHMWKPAFLTKEYVSGRRATYFNPARFFAITLILFFLLMTYSLSHSDLDMDSQDARAEITKSQLVTQYDTIVRQIVPTADSIQLDSLRRVLFRNAKHVDEDTMFTGTIMYTDLSKYAILKSDAYSLSSEELNEKYDITDRWDKLVIRQTIRINKNKESTLAFTIGNLSWVVILVVFFIAMLMKLIYIRGKYYYVEHAVLLMLFHAKVFFVLNAIILLPTFFIEVHEDTMATIMVITNGTALIYLYITLKLYYQQGWFKTFIKFGIIGIGYLMSMVFFMVIVSLIGAALF